MSAYEKPMIHVVPEQAEGIFMASGDKTVCRFVKSSDTQYSTKSKNLQQCHRKQSGSKTRKLIKIKSRF